MQKQGAGLSLKSYDDIFSTQAERDEIAGNVEHVQQLRLSELVPFKNHPFKVKDDEGKTAVYTNVDAGSDFASLSL